MAQIYAPPIPERLRQLFISRPELFVRGPVDTKWAGYWARLGPFGPPPWADIEPPPEPPPIPEAPEQFISIFGPYPVTPDGASPVLWQKLQDEWRTTLSAYMGDDGASDIMGVLGQSVEFYEIFDLELAVYQTLYFNKVQWYGSFLHQQVRFFEQPLYTHQHDPDGVVRAYQMVQMQRYDTVPMIIAPGHSPIFLGQMMKKFKDDREAMNRLSAAILQWENMLRRVREDSRS